MSDYQEQNGNSKTVYIMRPAVFDMQRNFDDFLNSVETDLIIKEKKSPLLSSQEQFNMIDLDELHGDHEWYEEYPRLVRKIGHFEEAKREIEDTYERLKHTTSFQPRDFHSSPYHYHPPPAYHAPAPSPPPYKAVYEVNALKMTTFFSREMFRLILPLFSLLFFP